MRELGWADMAKQVVERHAGGTSALSFSDCVASAAQSFSLTMTTLWRHIAAYKFWEAMRGMEGLSALPTPEAIQHEVSSLYLVTLSKLAASAPRSVSERFVRAIADGNPLSAAEINAQAAIYAKHAPRGRGAGVKSIRMMQHQPEVDKEYVCADVLDALPAWFPAAREAGLGLASMRAAHLSGLPAAWSAIDALVLAGNGNSLAVAAVGVAPPGKDARRAFFAQVGSVPADSAWVVSVDPVTPVELDQVRGAGVGLVRYDATRPQGDRVVVLAEASSRVVALEDRFMVLVKILAGQMVGVPADNVLRVVRSATDGLSLKNRSGFVNA